MFYSVGNISASMISRLFHNAEGDLSNVLVENKKRNASHSSRNWLLFKVSATKCKCLIIISSKSFICAHRNQSCDMAPKNEAAFDLTFAKFCCADVDLLGERLIG